MKLIKRIVKSILYVLLLPISYVIISLLLSAITIDRTNENQDFDKVIYLSTNGVHLDIVIPENHLDHQLRSGLRCKQSDNYFSFGWGDENFYVNTPNWGDLTFKNAFRAMFMKSSTLMHVTRYRSKGYDWIEIKISKAELRRLNRYLQNTFQTNGDGAKLLLKDQGYTVTDDFYRAKGSYSCFKTCNSWANSAFKQSGLKACLWTPFDFGLMKKHQ